MSQPVITMYVRQDCEDVIRTREFLKARGVTWTEIDIDEDLVALAKVEEWNAGRSPTPTILIGDQLLVEPGKRELDAALALG